MYWDFPATFSRYPQLPIAQDLFLHKNCSERQKLGGLLVDEYEASPATISRLPLGKLPKEAVKIFVA